MYAQGIGTDSALPDHETHIENIAMKTTNKGNIETRGAPVGNRNNMRHGLRGGQLPKDSKYIENRLNKFRRTLEDAVLACKGFVSIPDAAAIQTALRWERHACLAHRWLTKQDSTLSPADKLKFSEAIGKASDNRDRAIRTLKIDRDDSDNVLNALYSRPYSNGDDDGTD